MDFRDLFGDKDSGMRLYPYAKNVFWRPESNVLGMTIQIYDDNRTQEFTFAFNPAGSLKHFLDQLEVGNEEENSVPEEGH